MRHKENIEMKYEDLIGYIKRLYKSDLQQAKVEFKDYWYSWDTVGDDNYEGVILEIEDDDYHVLCTDGIVRCV
jgi:hypothetical protein